MVEERSRIPALKPWMIIAAAALVVVFAAAALYAWKRARTHARSTGATEPPKATVTEPPDFQRMFVQRVEEDRGAPTGNKADIEVPDEMKLYKDRRRFLDIQVAEGREHNYDIP